MYGVRSQFVLSLLAACICLTLFASASSSQSQKRHKQPPVTPVAPQSAPAAPPAVPLTLQQMPAVPPRVTYTHGELTIVSQNSTLGDILRAVHDQTGAVLDVPGSVTERVVGQMGPGSPREVLAELLNGSRFNYVILGSAADPDKVEKVVLTSKPAETAQAPANPPTPAPQQAAGQFGFNQQSPSDDDDDATESSADQANPGQPPAQAPIRTPEQLLQDLQRQQQSQQQQQQGQPATPAPRERN